MPRGAADKFSGAILWGPGPLSLSGSANNGENGLRGGGQSILRGGGQGVAQADTRKRGDNGDVLHIVCFLSDERLTARPEYTRFPAFVNGKFRIFAEI